MLAALVAWSLRWRGLVGAVAALLLVLGVYAEPAGMPSAKRSMPAGRPGIARSVQAEWHGIRCKFGAEV